MALLTIRGQKGLAAEREKKKLSPNDCHRKMEGGKEKEGVRLLRLSTLTLTDR